MFFSFLYFLLMCVCVCFLNKKSYILINIWLCRRVSDNKNSPGQFVGTSFFYLFFFWPKNNVEQKELRRITAKWVQWFWCNVPIQRWLISNQALLIRIKPMFHISCGLGFLSFLVYLAKHYSLRWNFLTISRISNRS